MTTVLVVDDSEVDRRLIGGLLEETAQFTVTYAHDGAEAMERLRRLTPDLIVTDLQMPEMDGLELTAAVRAEYPEVPVILITAHGSEDTAIAALEWGAASYVPKVQLAQRLVDTARQILAISVNDRQHFQLLEHLRETAFRVKLPNDPALTGALVDYVQLILASMRFCDATDRVRICVALEECLANAMYHGNLELSRDQVPYRSMHALSDDLSLSQADERRMVAPYKDRMLHVLVHVTPDEAKFVIRDEGPGFDVSTLPAPNDLSLLSKVQRGIFLMHSFMDEVRYNETGNEVTLIKFRSSRSAEDSASPSEVKKEA